jgi:hypothetical protein
MSICLHVYAEVYNGLLWEKKGENLHGRTDRGLYSLLSEEMNPRSWLLSRDISDQISNDSVWNSPWYLKYKRSKRLFPGDTSDKILGDFFYDYPGSDIHKNNLYDDNWDEIYTPQLVRQILTQQGIGKDTAMKYGVGWVSLSELNNFDWNRSRSDWDGFYRHYGEVPIEYAEMFGDGEQFFPEGFTGLLLYIFHYPLHSTAPIPNEHVCENGFVLVSWIQNSTYSYTFDGEIFAYETLPLLQTYGKPKDVRIVFWIVG